MTDKLKNSIEKLYETFEKYNCNCAMSGSPLYGDLDKWNEALFSKPLRELDQNDLSRFTGKAITTWGGTNDFKHFLPRIFEVTAKFKTPYEIWIAFDKLSLADFQNWNMNEQEVIHEFMISLWEDILSNNSEHAESQFKDYFSAIAHFYPNFTELLNLWDQSNSVAGIKHLANFLLEEQTALFERKKISGFEDQNENAEELITWVLSDKTLEKFKQKYTELEKENFADKIYWAQEIIRTERKNHPIKR